MAIVTSRQTEGNNCKGEVIVMEGREGEGGATNDYDHFQSFL
jgi:hypothetical protein